jgi:hypothetical protein
MLLCPSQPEQSMAQTDRVRRHFSAEQKVAILREHLLDRRAVSDVREVTAVT